MLGRESQSRPTTDEKVSDNGYKDGYKAQTYLRFFGCLHASPRVSSLLWVLQNITSTGPLAVSGERSAPCLYSHCLLSDAVSVFYFTRWLHRKSSSRVCDKLSLCLSLRSITSRSTQAADKRPVCRNSTTLRKRAASPLYSFFPTIWH